MLGLFSDHLTNVSRSLYKCSLSPPLLSLLNTFVSSANFGTLLVMLSSKSLIYINNNKDHNTDHCGTPLKTYFQFDNYPSTTTRCLLSVSHCTIQLVMPSPIPWAFNLSCNLSCGTLSKPFRKSKYRISTGDPSSIHSKKA